MEFYSAFEDVQTVAHDFTAIGSDVVVSNTAHLRGRDGIKVVARSTYVYTVENGQIARLRMFQERAEALEAAGLRGVAHLTPGPLTGPRARSLSARVWPVELDVGHRA